MKNTIAEQYNNYIGTDEIIIFNLKNNSKTEQQLYNYTVYTLYLIYGYGDFKSFKYSLLRLADLFIEYIKTIYMYRCSQIPKYITNRNTLYFV